MCDTTNYTITLAVDTKMVKYKVRMYMHGVSLAQAMRIHGYGQRLRSVMVKDRENCTASDDSCGGGLGTSLVIVILDNE